jgi:ribonuclease P protein component
VKRIQSLKGKKTFTEVFKKGRRYRSDQMELIVLKANKIKKKSINTDKDINSRNGIYAGIQITRKYGNAVQRNRIRRQIKAVFNELFRDKTDELYIILRPNYLNKTRNFTDLRTNIATLLNKAGIYA